jgi:hypothetical protein
MWLSADALTDRILAEESSPVFIVGAGVAAPVVPGTDAIVDLIKSEIRPRNPRALEALEAALAPGGNRYQIAFDKLLSVCGPNVANRVIRRAVLSGREDPRPVPDVALALDGDQAACARVTAQVQGWRLTPALEALGAVATWLSQPRCRIFTTNFDPLVDIAVRRAGGRAVTMALAADGNPSAADQDGAVLIAQLHGDWYRADALHTPTVLTTDRPQMRGALRALMSNRLVVVLGYAGWDDVLTQAFSDMMSDAYASFDLRWAFREDSPTDIEAKYPELLRKLAPMRGRRVFCHTGVDANVFMPGLARAFEAGGRAGVPAVGGRPAKGVLKPRVYISYSWRTAGMKPRAFDLAERLRAAGIDARLDLYYAESRHGFLPPRKHPGDERAPWTIWQEEQVVDADRVLLLCTPEYFQSVELPEDPVGKRPGAWFDVQFMKKNLGSGRVGDEKFIPAGFGSFEDNERYVPMFIRGATYYDLAAKPREGFGFDDLVRRLETEFPTT